MICGENCKVIGIIEIFKLGEEIPLDASGFVWGGILHAPVYDNRLSDYLLLNYFGVGHLPYFKC